MPPKGGIRGKGVRSGRFYLGQRREEGTQAFSVGTLSGAYTVQAGCWVSEPVDRAWPLP